jgi:hypothetical protein
MHIVTALCVNISVVFVITYVIHKNTKQSRYKIYIFIIFGNKIKRNEFSGRIKIYQRPRVGAP